MVTGFMINHSKIPDSFYNHFTFELSLKLCFMNNHGKYAQVQNTVQEPSNT